MFFRLINVFSFIDNLFIGPYKSSSIVGFNNSRVGFNNSRVGFHSRVL